MEINMVRIDDGRFVEEFLYLAEKKITAAENVFFVHESGQKGTFLFLKEGTWYGAYIKGCLSPIKVKWGEDKVIVDCENGEGKPITLCLVCEERP